MPFEQLPSAFKDWFSDSIKFSLLVAHLRQIEYCKLGAVTQRKLIENAADIIADGSPHSETVRLQSHGCFFQLRQEQ